MRTLASLARPSSSDLSPKKASFITAASTPKHMSYGFVFKDCNLTGDGLEKGSVYLGRPWRIFAKTVFINCNLGAHIHPEGWKEWNAYGTAYYAEYGSTGRGGDVSDRVAWSHQLNKKQLKKYSKSEIFNNWEPIAR